MEVNIEQQDMAINLHSKVVDSDEKGVFTHEDYDDYSHEVSFYIKKVWICIQATMMTYFMIKGLVFYNKA